MFSFTKTWFAIMLFAALSACSSSMGGTPHEVGPTPSPTLSFLGVTPTPSPSPTVVPSFPPSPQPTSVSTTEAVGATGSTLTFPTLMGTFAVLSVPAGITEGSVATLTTTNGFASGGIYHDYGPIVETFTLSLNVASSFHPPAITITFPAPLTSSESIDVFNGGDYAVFPSGTNPLMVTQSLTCESLTAGQQFYVEVSSPATGPTIPTPTAGPTTCPA